MIIPGTKNYEAFLQANEGTCVKKQVTVHTVKLQNKVYNDFSFYFDHN